VSPSCTFLIIRVATVSILYYMTRLLDHSWQIQRWAAVHEFGIGIKRNLVSLWVAGLIICMQALGIAIYCYAACRAEKEIIKCSCRKERQEWLRDKNVLIIYPVPGPRSFLNSDCILTSGFLENPRVYRINSFLPKLTKSKSLSLTAKSPNNCIVKIQQSLL
jgi:hypothetical protein